MNKYLFRTKVYNNHLKVHIMSSSAGASEKNKTCYV